MNTEPTSLYHLRDINLSTNPQLQGWSDWSWEKVVGIEGHAEITSHQTQVWWGFQDGRVLITVSQPLEYPAHCVTCRVTGHWEKRSTSPNFLKNMVFKGMPAYEEKEHWVKAPSGSGYWVHRGQGNERWHCPRLTNMENSLSSDITSIKSKLLDAAIDLGFDAFWPLNPLAEPSSYMCMSGVLTTDGPQSAIVLEGMGVSYPETPYLPMIQGTEGMYEYTHLFTGLDPSLSLPIEVELGVEAKVKAFYKKHGEITCLGVAKDTPTPYLMDSHKSLREIGVIKTRHQSGFKASRFGILPLWDPREKVRASASVIIQDYGVLAPGLVYCGGLFFRVPLDVLKARTAEYLTSITDIEAQVQAKRDQKKSPLKAYIDSLVQALEGPGGYPEAHKLLEDMPVLAAGQAGSIRQLYRNNIWDLGLVDRVAYTACSKLAKGLAVAFLNKVERQLKQGRLNSKEAAK